MEDAVELLSIQLASTEFRRVSFRPFLIAPKVCALDASLAVRDTKQAAGSSVKQPPGAKHVSTQPPAGDSPAPRTSA